MFANKRQQKICELLEKNGAVTTSELTKSFDVSTETIRRDLLALEELHRLQRVHGGAVTIGEVKPFQSLPCRNEENYDRKAELAQTAAKLVKNGDIIGMDAGSTAILFAEALKDTLDQLTVVTHSLDVFEILCRHKDFKVLLLGGHFLREENSFYGPLVIETLKKIHMPKVFIFPSAVSLHYGICDHQTELYQVQVQMRSCGDRIYVLADSSKFEKNALLKIDDMNPRYTYVTDSNLSEELKQLYFENEIKILTRKDDIK